MTEIRRWGREANPPGKRQSHDPGQVCTGGGGTQRGVGSTEVEQEGQSEAEKETQRREGRQEKRKSQRQKGYKDRETQMWTEAKRISDEFRD